MKKINFSLCFLAGILLCSFVMVACSSDDDDDNDENGGSANSSKRIAKKTQEKSPINTTRIPFNVTQKMVIPWTTIFILSLTA